MTEHTWTQIEHDLGRVRVMGAPGDTTSMA